jgi:uncharacterized membrane protein YukC
MPSRGTFRALFASIRQARGDYTEAMNLARRLGYHGLTTFIDSFLRDVQMKKKLLDANLDLKRKAVKP